MTPLLLVLNAGSSSLKFGLYESRPDGPAAVASGEFQGVGHALALRWQTATDATAELLPVAGAPTHGQALQVLLAQTRQRLPGRPLRGAAHRVVHGGHRAAHAVVDAELLSGLKALAPLAPLHQPPALEAIEALAAQHPALPQVACFDTAFHTGQPEVATRFALPRALHDEGVRRYGFHGLSYEFVAHALADVAGAEVAHGRVIVAHLGAGASLCAMRDGRSVATTMGFTALDGLPMARRCGCLDPGVVLYLIEQKGWAVQRVSQLLYQESGLLGVSGVSDDMRTLLASTDPHAAEAVALFVYRLAREIGSLAAALGGLDALVFTGGIGEHAAPVRAAVCRACAWLGVRLDEAANADGRARLTGTDSPVSAWCMATDEDLQIARHALRLLPPA